MENKIELIGTYGDDYTHALSAWTSTKRELTIKREERLERFLKELADNGHHTPFEKSSIHFLLTSDVGSHIHLLKHRIGVSTNAESLRYQEFKQDSWYVPKDWLEEEKIYFNSFIKMCYKEYHDCIDRLVNKQGYSRSRAKESARYYLPYANQLKQDVMFNFRSFVHFQKLRNSEFAQIEIQQIAKKMLQIVKETHKFDFSLKAFGLM